MPVNSAGIIKPIPNGNLRDYWGDPHRDGYPSFTVPILGRVQFHPRVAEVFLQVWQDIDAAHLGGLVDMQDWRESGGTWNYRHILHNPNNPLSPHSWATCVDFNVSHVAGADGSERQISGTNYGNPRLAPSLVKLAPFFESYGFTWGGRWNTPDPMHYEATEITCALLEHDDLSTAAQAAVDKARAKVGALMGGATGGTLGIVRLGHPTDFLVPCNPVVSSGATWVDFRALAEALGGEVGYERNAPTLKVNGSPVDITAFCQAPVSGPTRCPLRPLLEALHWRVAIRNGVEPDHTHDDLPRVYVEKRPA